MVVNFKHGLVWQDHQHEQLLACMASLNKKRETAHEFDELASAIAFLEFYVQAHFDLESHYMDIFDYPDRDKHQLLHDEFIEKITTCKKKARFNRDSSALMTELCSWFMDHILGADRELAEFLKSKKK